MASNPPPNQPARGNRVPTNRSASATNQALAPGAARTQMQPAQHGQTAAQTQFVFQPQIPTQGQAQGQQFVHGQQQNQGQQQHQGQFQGQQQAPQFQAQGQSQAPFQARAFAQARLRVQQQQQQGFGQQQQQAPSQFQVFGQPQFQAQQQAPFLFQPQGAQNQGQAQASLGQVQSQGQQQNPFQFRPQIQTQQRQAQPQHQSQLQGNAQQQNLRSFSQPQAALGQNQSQGLQQNPFQFRPQGQAQQRQTQFQNQVQLSQPQNHTQNHQVNGQPRQNHGQLQGFGQPQGQPQQHQAQLQNQGQRQGTAQQQNLSQQQIHGQHQGLGRPQTGPAQSQSQGLQQNPFLFQPQVQAQQRQAQAQNQSQINGAAQQQQSRAQSQQANGQLQQNLGQQQLQRQFQQRQAQLQSQGQLQGAAAQQQNLGQQQSVQGFGQPQSQGLQQNPFQFQPQGQIPQRQVQPQNQGQLQGAAAQQQGLSQQQNHSQHQGLTQPQFQAQQQHPLQQFGQQQAPYQFQMFGQPQFQGQQQASFQFQGQGQPQLPPPAGFFIPNAPFQAGAAALAPIPLWFQPPGQQQQQLPLQGYGQPGEEPAGVRQFNQGVTVRQARTQDELDDLGINGTDFVDNLDDADIEDGDEAVQDDQSQEEEAEDSEDEDMQDEEMQDADTRDAGTRVEGIPYDRQQLAQIVRNNPHVPDPHMYDAVIHEDAWDTESDREPDVEVETRKVNGATKHRFKFTEAFLKEHFDGKDPYYTEKKEIVAVPLMNSGIDLVTALCKNLELAIELGKHLHGEDILNLYIASRGFREALDGHMLSSIREWIRSRAPEAGRLFPWRSVAKFLVPDPAKRSGSGTDKTPGGVRLIPGMKYLQMILGRDRYCRHILAIMARMGLRVPDTMHTTLLRLWHLLEVSTSAQRSQVMADTSLWTDQHLYNAQFFFVKLTMAFNHPFFRPHSHEMLHLMMGQRGLYPLWQCLTRKKFRTLTEIIELKARYDMNLPPPAWFNPDRRFMTSFHGVPFHELGIGHCEGWGAGTRHLLRPDELVVTESINRALDLDKHLNHMLVWGYINFETGENLVPTEEEMYISDEEEVLDGVDTTCWWQKRHALKKRWNELTPEQRQDIEEDEEDERLRAMAWSVQYDPDEKNDRHARTWESESEDESDQEYDPNVEINRGYRMQALPKDQPSQVPALDDEVAWHSLCTDFLMECQVEVDDDAVAKATAWLKFSRSNMVTPFDQDRYDLGDPFMRSRIDWSPPRPPRRGPGLDDDDDDNDDEMEDDDEEGEEEEEDEEGEEGDEEDDDEDEEDDEEDYEDYYDADDDEMQE